MPKQTPVVFISSTKEDLGLYRNAAKDAALRAGFLPRMMEYFLAGGKYPPYKECMAKVDECDVLVAIVAHRYGWVPPDQPGRKTGVSRASRGWSVSGPERIREKSSLLWSTTSTTGPWSCASPTG